MPIRPHAIIQCAALSLIACEGGPPADYAENEVFQEAVADQRGSGDDAENEVTQGESNEDGRSDAVESCMDQAASGAAPGPVYVQRPNGFIPHEVFINTYYMAMHAGPDASNEQLDTADEVFTKYFTAGTWNGPLNVPFYGMGPGSANAKTALSFATWYMTETTGPAGLPLSSMTGWDYSPSANYTQMLAAAATHQRPIAVHFNGTRWMEPIGNPCTDTSLWCMFNQTQDFLESELQRDQHGQPFGGEDGSNSLGQDMLGQCAPGHCYLTIARGHDVNDDQGTLYRRYKKRNLQQAIDYLLDWAEAHPGLLIAITMDSETTMGAIGGDAGTFPRIGDYSVPMLSQYRSFQKAKWGTVQNYNNYFQSCQPAINSLDDISPPTDTDVIDMLNPNGLDRCWAEWHEFRVDVVREMVSDTSRWAYEAGVPFDRILSHQSVNDRFDFYMYEASPIRTAKTVFGRVGIDLYEPQLFQPNGYGGITWKIDIMNQAQDLDPRWAVTEFNAGLGPEAWGGSASQPNGQGFSKCSPADAAAIYQRTFQTLENAWFRGNRIVMPFLWNPADRTPQNPTAGLAAYGIGSCEPAMRAYRDFIAARS